MAIIFLVLIICAIYIQKKSLDKALEGFEFSHDTSLILAAPGEIFQIYTKLVNYSARFVPFIKIEGFLPAHVSAEAKTGLLHDEARKLFSYSFTTYLGPHSGLNYSFTASIKKRGRHIFRGARIWGGDFLGLKQKERLFAEHRELIVYPKEDESFELKEMVGSFLGDISVRRFIMEDPVLTAGFREYTGREPMKTISWTQSARKNELMVKNYDFTTEPAVSVILNAECNLRDKEDLLERCFSMTHTVCRTLENRRIKYDFRTNAFISGTTVDLSYIAEGLGSRHLMAVLEALGRASYHTKIPFSGLIKNIKETRTMIIISPAGKDDIRIHLNMEAAKLCLVLSPHDLIASEFQS